MQHDVDPRTARWVLLAIVVLALAIRVVYVLQSRASPMFDAPQMDALYHVEWARALLRGENYQPGPFFRAPGYPWFLAATMRVFGDGLLAPRLVQAVIGAGSCALVYLLGARLFDRRTGLVAAAIAATYATLVYFDGELLLPVLEVPTCLAAVLAAVALGERPSARNAALAGVALGIAAIVRPNVLLWGVAVAIWIVARGGPPVAARVRLALVYGLATLAPILPITVYNATAGDDLVLISTQGGVNFWIGNNPASDGSTAIAPGTRPDWWGGFHDTTAQAEALEGRPLKPSEVSRHYAARAWRWIADEPVAALKLLAWKLRLYWTVYELGNNQDEVFFAREFGPILRGSPIGFGLVAPLGLVGLAITARRWRRIGPASMFVPAWCASVVAFFVCARFRIPMMPVLGVFAAHAVLEIAHAVSTRWWRRLAILLGASGVLALLVQAVPARVDRTPAKGLWQLGLLRSQAGDLAGAESLFLESIAANPRFPLAHQDLGWMRMRQGRAAEAQASFLEALQLAPQTIGALQGLVETSTALARPRDAVIAAREFARVAPQLSASHYELGRALLALGDPASLDEARLALSRAVQTAREADEAFNAHLVAGELERSAGKPREAIAEYEAALAARSAPDAQGWFWKCQVGRLQSIASADGPERARAEARALAARFAGDPRSASSLEPFLAR